MRRLAVRFPIEVYGAARTRSRAIPTGQRDRNGCPQYRGGNYDDPKYDGWKKQVAPLFQLQAPRVPFDGPCMLSLVIVLPHTKAVADRKRHTPREWHTVVPDLDNLEKSVKDAMQKAGWIVNDSRICKVAKEKVRAAKGEKPSVSIVLRELPPYA